MDIKKTALLATILTGVTVISSNAVADDNNIKAKKEKCYGVVAKGMNDCATASHSCAGQANVDAHPEEWVYVPAGLCDKLHQGKKNSDSDKKTKK